MSSDLSMTQLASLAKKAQSGDLDGSEIEQVWQSLDDSTKQQAIANIYQQAIVPHAVDVREEAATLEDNTAIRERLAELPETEQDDIFYSQLADVVSSFIQLRQDPQEAASRLKGMFRDPYAMESLLLIFSNQEHIDAEYGREMKDLAAETLRDLGVALMPEAYPTETRQAVAEKYRMEIPDV